MYLVYMFLTRKKFANISIWAFIVLLFGLVNSACQREYSDALDESQRNQSLDLASARSYYRELRAREGDHVNMELYQSDNSPLKSAGSETPNRKHIVFEKAFWTQTRQST